MLVYHWKAMMWLVRRQCVSFSTGEPSSVRSRN